MLKIFIDNEWVEYNYDILYSTRGYTDTPSVMVSLYDSSMHSLEAWKNSGYIWVQQDIQWYPERSTPYYILTDRTLELYKIDSLESFKIYEKEGIPYIRYNSQFNTVDYLHDNLGYTETPSEIWDIDEGVPWSWYNEDLNLYWDDRAGKKYWTPTPPTPEQGGGIIPADSEMYPQPQWEYDLSQLPSIFSSTGKFQPTHNTTRLYTVFKEWDTWEEYQTPQMWSRYGDLEIVNTPPVKRIVFDEWEQFDNGVNNRVFYKDVIKSNTNIYVNVEESYEEISFKSASSQNWGSTTGTGYAKSVTSFYKGRYLKIGNSHWYNLNDLFFNLGVYPSIAIESTLIKNSLTSNVAIMILEEKYYLIEKDSEDGWLTETEIENRGWQEIE